MRCNVGKVEKERSITDKRFFEEFVGIVVEYIGHEEALLRESPSLRIEIEVISVNFVKVTYLRLAIGAKEAIKSPFNGEVSALPLANHHRVITVCLEHLGNQDALAKVLGLIPSTPRVANLLAVQPRQQRCASRSAHGIVVELRESQSIPRQGIDVGRGNLAAIATEIRPAHVIGHDEDDVRSPVFARGNIARQCCIPSNGR
jgi:hypothetical protein